MGLLFKTRLRPILIVIWTICSYNANGEDIAKQEQNQSLSGISNTEFQLELNSLKDSLNVSVARGLPLHIARNCTELGDLLYSNGLFVQALEYYNRALKITDEDNDQIHDIYCEVFLKRGFLQQQSGNLKLAIENFEKAIDEARLRKNKALEAKSFGFLGEAYEKKGEYNVSLKFQNQALDLFKEINEDIGIATVYKNIGSVYEDLKDNPRSLEYFSRSYQIVKNSDVPLEINVLNNLGDIHFRLGHHEIALNFFEKAIELSKKLNDLRELESAHDDIAEVYEADGNYEKAFLHKSLSKSYFEDIDKKENSRQLNVLNVMYEIDQKENQIAFLEEKNALNELRQRVYFLLIVVFLVSSALVIYTLRRKQKVELKLRAYQEGLLKSKLQNQKIEEANLRNNIRLKTSALSNYSLHLSNKNKLLNNISNDLKEISKRPALDFNKQVPRVIKKIDENIKSENEWEAFKTYFEQIHPEFIKKLVAKADKDLSPSDIKLALLIRMNLSSKEIASMLRVSPDSIRVSRHRLRKKLPIEAESNLVSFMLKL